MKSVKKIIISVAGIFLPVVALIFLYFALTPAQ